MKALSWLRAMGLAAMIFSGTAQAEGVLTFTQPKPDLARTPPMGWSSWNSQRCKVNEVGVREIADTMVANGMRDAGYRYVNVDDCWSVGRTPDGELIPDPKRFPSGMKALGDYIHARGLKFGIHTDGGVLTCNKAPGTAGHEFQDARTFARWGIDYVKYDWCNTGEMNTQTSYTIMAMALRATGRDIVFSLCEWGSTRPWLWARDIGHLWRTTGDLHDSWDKDAENETSFIKLLDLNADLASYAGPNAWNDPDMLQVGNGGMTDTEYRAHFSLWAILAAPLIAGNELATMSAATKAILLNRDVIAVDQDALGRAGGRIWKDGDREIWARPLSGGERAVVLFNRGTAPQRIAVDWGMLDLPAALRADVTDLWSKAVTRGVRGAFAAEVAPHGVVMIRLRPRV